MYRIIFAPEKNSKILATSLLSARDFTPLFNSLGHETTCIIELSPFFKLLNGKEGITKEVMMGENKAIMGENKAVQSITVVILRFICYCNGRFFTSSLDRL